MLNVNTLCMRCLFQNVKVGSAGFPNLGTFMYLKESCVIAKKLVLTCKDARKEFLVQWYPNICNQLDQLQNMVNKNCLQSGHPYSPSIQLNGLLMELYTLVCTVPLVDRAIGWRIDF